jgi:hypothetical protein
MTPQDNLKHSAAPHIMPKFRRSFLWQLWGMSDAWVARVLRWHWVGRGSQAPRASGVLLRVRGLATVIFRTFRLCLRSENAVDNSRNNQCAPTQAPPQSPPEAHQIPKLQTPPVGCVGSTQRTVSGRSAGSMSRLTATACPSLRHSTHSSTSCSLALISWCGTYGGT